MHELRFIASSHIKLDNELKLDTEGRDLWIYV